MDIVHTEIKRFLTSITDVEDIAATGALLEKWYSIVLSDWSTSRSRGNRAGLIVIVSQRTQKDIVDLPKQLETILISTLTLHVIKTRAN